MRLIELRIENFRSFKDETIHFDDYSCLVGANGAGKSGILTALNVFFRNNASTATDVHILSEEDFHHKDTNQPIKITVTFAGLSEAAKEEFKHYYRQGKLTVFAKAEWDSQARRAEVKQCGARLVMQEFAPFFAAVEAKAKVTDLKQTFDAIRAAFSDLPEASTKQAMTDALREYEESHPEKCKLTDDTDQFYGWSKGANRLRPFLQWVFIPAVKDASTEQEEGNKTALGQLLERTIRTKVNFDDNIQALRTSLEKSYREMLAKERTVLKGLEGSIATRLRDWTTPSANVSLDWHYDPNKSLVVNEPIARVAIGEDNFLGEVARLGHGMQRAFIVTMLQELAEGNQEHGPTLLLGFEEPELYQHPPQAQHMASLLEDLAGDKKRNTQVIVSTHSPFFVSTKGFENVRYIRKRRADNCSVISSTTYAEVEALLAEATGDPPSAPTALMAQIEQVMHPSQKELYFTRVAVLVEGPEDVAYISTYLHLTQQWGAFRKHGCHFIGGDGKTSMSRPLAIARKLSIPAFVVFDSDAHETKDATKHQKDNLCILRLCGLQDDDASVLPTEDQWHKNVVMWRSTISKVVPEEYGIEDWTKAVEVVRQRDGFPAKEVKQKNCLLIAAVMEHLWTQGKRSAILDRLCTQILTFAKESTT